MEYTTNDFAGNLTNAALFETGQSDFYISSADFPGPEDENENDDEDKNEDKGKASNDDEPALDKEVVHSPLKPETGGKPQ